MGKRRRGKIINSILAKTFSKGTIICIDYYGKREIWEHNGKAFKSKGE